MNLLEVRNLNFIINEGLRSRDTKNVLSDISFILEKGKILGISGESGSGKTTLAKILSGILTKTSGEIKFNFPAEQKNKKANPVQVLFQNTGDILNPLRKVEDVIKEALTISANKKNAIEPELERILNAVNFKKELWQRRGYELSGGEQQRAALARLLCVNPALLILDEPLASQDAESQTNLIKLLKEINLPALPTGRPAGQASQNFGITLIIIAHNLKAIKQLADQVLVIYKGKIVEQGATEDIFTNPKHPYTKFLLKSENYNLTYEDFLEYDSLPVK
jgi:ABC-type dipeptide/oligopeptide/nickel transport system ATPase subunit